MKNKANHYEGKRDMASITLGDLALYNIYKLLKEGDKDTTFFVLTQKGFEDKSIVSCAFTISRGRPSPATARAVEDPDPGLS